MSIISKKTNSQVWLDNSKDNIINQKTTICNYWCSDGNVSTNIGINTDLVEVHKDNGPEIIGKILAWGKSNSFSPVLHPNLSKITIEDIYGIEIINNSITIGQSPRVSALLNGTYSNHKSDLLNCMNGKPLQDFLYEINSSLTSNIPYTYTSEFAYLLFEPIVLAYNNERDDGRIRKIKSFNAKNQKTINDYGIKVNERGAIILLDKKV